MTIWLGLFALLLPALALGAAVFFAMNKLGLNTASTAGKYLGLVGAIFALGLGIFRSLESIFSPTVSVNLRVAQFWPSLPESLDYQSKSTIKVVAGGFQAADVQVQGLGLPARLAFALDALMWGLVFGITFFVLFRIASHVSQSLEFKSLSYRWIQTMGGMVMGAGVMGTISSTFGRVLLSQQLFDQNASWKINQTIANPWLPKTGETGDSPLNDLQRVYGLVTGSFNQGLTVDFPVWPLAIGLVMLLVATVIKRGQRLNDEVEDLI